MKKLLSLFICVLLVFILCGCSGTEKMKENLSKSGYTVEEMSESKINGLNSEIKYTYNGMGTIIYGFYATNEYGNSVFVIEFSNRDDMTVAYRELKAQLSDSESIDSSGKILVYGFADGVKTALK